MKKFLLMLPLVFLPLAPAKAEALTWKEFWEPFAESYHHGHDHGSGHWHDWRYDHHHHRPRPRRRMCEVVVSRKYWIPGHYLGSSNQYIPGYYEHRDHLQWEPCRGTRH